jgi:hypothetical protein
MRNNLARAIPPPTHSRAKQTATPTNLDSATEATRTNIKQTKLKQKPKDNNHK